MSVRWLGSMSGSRLKSPLLLLFLLLLNTGTVLCQDGEDGDDADAMGEEDMSAGDPADENTPTSDPFAEDAETTMEIDQPPGNEDILVDDTQTFTELGSGAIPNTEEEGMDPTISSEVENLNTIIILIPVIVVVLIITTIVAGILINRRGNGKAKKRGLTEEDPYLDGSPSEKVPMPMFEEDVPSVLELEMEELDQWMQQDGEAAKESMQA